MSYIYNNYIKNLEDAYLKSYNYITYFKSHYQGFPMATTKSSKSSLAPYHVQVRKAGGSGIISLPKALLSALSLDIGMELIASLEKDRIVLTPIKKNKMSLDELLAHSPKEAFEPSPEDKEWLDTSPVGKELL